MPLISGRPTRVGEDADARPRTALFGWSPPPLASESRLNRRVDRLFPATGRPLAICFGVVVAFLLVAPLLPKR
jgi:hypothetical protein